MISVFGSKVGNEEILQVSESINNQWLGMGPKVKKFENIFSKRLHIDNFIMVDSGSNALYMACKLLNLKKGSEIIVPSFTWVACANSVILAGYKPVFCDVDLTSMNITVENIKPHITEKTGAIMVVHYAGLPVDMDSILSLELPVIEDAAHAVDSIYKGKSCGSIGDVGIYSFDAIKNLAVGEGGGLTMKSSELFDRAKTLRYCGIGKSGFDASETNHKWWEYNIRESFIKMNPSDIEEIITPLESTPGYKHSYFTYAIRVKNRNELAKYLLDNGVYTTVRYHPLHLNEIYKQTYKILPNCETLNDEALNIPLHPNMSGQDADVVVELISSFLRKNKF